MQISTQALICPGEGVLEQCEEIASDGDAALATRRKLVAVQVFSTFFGMCLMLTSSGVNISRPEADAA